MSVYLRGLLIISYNTKYFLYQEFAVKVFFFWSRFFHFSFQWQNCWERPFVAIYNTENSKISGQFNGHTISSVQVLNFPSILGTVGIMFWLVCLKKSMTFKKNILGKIKHSGILSRNFLRSSLRQLCCFLTIILLESSIQHNLFAFCMI